MNVGPTIWLGYRDNAVTGDAAVSGGFPEVLYPGSQAVVLSTDDLPAATGAAVAGTPDTSHEWNVAKFRRMIVCDPDTGEQFAAYVLMTAPTAVSLLP